MDLRLDGIAKSSANSRTVLMLAANAAPIKVLRLKTNLMLF
jgi:hypothetical protein